MIETNSEGIVYILTNPAMPGLVKIGKTARDSIDARLSELYSTGVPVPFECAYAAKVADQTTVEKAFHLAFAPYRINAKREFFDIEPDQAIAILRLVAIEDVTPAIQEEAKKVDTSTIEASRKLNARRPNQNFVEMGIPIGSEISLAGTDITATIASERKVTYQGQEYSLTALTRLLMENEYNIQPGPHWYYQGRSLNEIYEDTYPLP